MRAVRGGDSKGSTPRYVASVGTPILYALLLRKPEGKQIQMKKKPRYIPSERIITKIDLALEAVRKSRREQVPGCITDDLLYAAENALSQASEMMHIPSYRHALSTLYNP